MKTSLGVIVFVASLATACSKNSEPPPPGTPGVGARNAPQESGPGAHRASPGGGMQAGGSMAAPPTGPAAEAHAMYDRTCAMCHGATGHGDGPMSAQLTPRPRDYSDKAWQATVTDAQLGAIILKGGAAFGKSAMMAPRPELDGKPEVLAALVAMVRSFAQ